MTSFIKAIVSGVIGITTAGFADAQQKAPAQPSPTQKTQANPAYTGSIHQTPWYTNPAVRQQLKLNDVQFNQLNKTYGNSWTQYQQAMKNLPANLTPAQRIQRSIELQQSFNNSFVNPANQIITDPQVRARFNQLHTQYRGYGALQDPAIQSKLALTDAQKQTLSQYQTGWQNEMAKIRQQYSTNPQAAATQLQTLRQQEEQRMNGVLNEQQRQTWSQLAGTPYNFPPNVYFPSNPTP